MMVSFVLSFFPRDVLDEILNLIESVSEDFPSYSWVCHRVLVRYIVHMYYLAVQASFNSDVVECSTLDRRVPGSILTQGMEIFYESVTGVSGL